MKNGFVLCITLFVAATAAAHGPRDIQCVYNSDCLDPLVCASSLCRIQCKNDRDCVNGWVCRSLRLFDVPNLASSPRLIRPFASGTFCPHAGRRSPWLVSLAARAGRGWARSAG